jgi:hypothetical protein
MAYDIGVRHDQVIRHRETEDGLVDYAVNVFAIMAQDDKGRRWVYVQAGFEGDTGEVEAREAIAALQGDPTTDPDAWQEVDPAYGSAAWGVEDDYNLACFEADCYDEPRPIW